MNSESLDRPSDSGLPGPKRPTITASFSGYEPPFAVVPIVERMLNSVPQKYLCGLSEIVLTNASGLPRKLRRSVTKSRKKKVRVAEARGLYHQAWEGKQAWIEIFVDNTLRGWERGVWLKIPFFREGQISEVLFHEIGHHIHYTTRPEYREREDVADVWKVKLERNYMRQRHPVLRAFLRGIVRLFDPLLGPWYRKRMKSQLEKGWMSRAEFEFCMKDERKSKRARSEEPAH